MRTVSCEYRYQWECHPLLHYHYQKNVTCQTQHNQNHKNQTVKENQRCCLMLTCLSKHHRLLQQRLGNYHCRQIHPKSKVVYCSPNLQNEFAVHVQSSDKRGNPKERTVPLAGSPSFTISLRGITNKVVFVNTYLKKQYQNQ